MGGLPEVRRGGDKSLPSRNSYPIIESRLKAVQLTKKQLRDLEKSGRTPSESLLKRYDLEQKAVLDAIERAKK